jgi:hypothetical protein
MLAVIVARETAPSSSVPTITRSRHVSLCLLELAHIKLTMSHHEYRDQAKGVLKQIRPHQRHRVFQQQLRFLPGRCSQPLYILIPSQNAFDLSWIGYRPILMLFRCIVMTFQEANPLRRAGAKPSSFGSVHSICRAARSKQKRLQNSTIETKYYSRCSAPSVGLLFRAKA